ncbi:MAG TPA: ABC-2 family transporter protein [Chthoniobacteraceae bacterium]|jgi:ABC-2 type transport system permease protein
MSLAKYSKVFSIGLQDTFVYRWNFLLRALFSIVPLFGTVFIWHAVFAARGGRIAGYDIREMVFYFLMLVLIDNLVTPTEDEWRIAAEIRDGQVSALIVKPLNHLAYRVSLFVSYRTLYAMVTLPVVAVIFWCLREYLRLPAHLATWPLFVLSVGMAAMLQFFIAYSLAMMAFWFLEISTLIFIFFSFEYFFSGQVFPLDILPMPFRAVVQWSPFTYEVFFPVQVFLERVHGAALVRGFCMQAGWMIAAFLIARLLWRSGVRRYQAVGG